RLERELGHLTCELRRDDRGCRNASRGETFDAADLVVLQALREAGYIADKLFTSANYYIKSSACKSLLLRAFRGF
ncbi:MAG TPA: hypothetical protein VLI65_01785, partial [Pyrinomonadaceae bacterium]|nr:hypothetical protein [Pyrinomonadaceae bacterium]